MADYDTTIPVLVAGGGACGAIAALAAHTAGAEVALLEAEARPMGSSGMSQGLIAAAGTRAQAAAGIEDSPERFLADIMAKTRGLADPVIAHTLAHQSGPTLDWMVDALDLPGHSTAPSAHPTATRPGASTAGPGTAGRTWSTCSTSAWPRPGSRC